MRRRDRIIKKIVAWAIAAIYHRVEVRQREGLTEYGPQLANASHFGGFSDPLLLVHAMDRVPRFIARDVIWRNPVARWVLNWVGAIPVHKPEDGGGRDGARSSNDQMFASTYAALHDGELVTIFPEGITVDTPQIAAIKTGSARIALGARADGVRGITIVSAGIHYDNKAALRSDVFIDIGWAFDLDTEIDAFVTPGDVADASNHGAVGALTKRMEHDLRLAAPDFEDWTMARNLSGAAQVALRPADGSDLRVGHADRERLARLLEFSVERMAVADAMTRYQADLDALGFSDEMLVGGLGNLRAFSGYIGRTALIALLLLPFALIGLVVNIVPMTLVWLIGRLKVSDAMMATVKPLGAVLVFTVMWAIWLVVAFNRGGIESLAAVGLLIPVYLFAVIAWFERLTLLVRAVRGFGRSRSVGQIYDTIWNHRTNVVEAVASAL